MHLIQSIKQVNVASENITMADAENELNRDKTCNIKCTDE